MQFQADIARGYRFERPAMVETTALGAAGLAGLATGVWRSAAEFVGSRRYARFEPSMDSSEREERFAAWERAVHAALVWARHRQSHTGRRPCGRSARHTCGSREAARPIVVRQDREGMCARRDVVVFGSSLPSAGRSPNASNIHPETNCR